MRSTTEDKYLLAVRDEEATELDNIDAEFDSQIAQSDAYFDRQIDATKDWANKQQELQQEQTDFTIEKIEQQKDQAKKDYTKEQSGAYVDWQKQSNQYGANAEKMASAGMANSGYSESSQVSMYNTYQSRVTAARESYNRAVLNYDNAIKEAQLQNSSILAQIAFESLQKQLELSLQGFQYKNTLILEKANARRQIQSLYQSKYMDVLDQINTENAQEKQKQQFNILDPKITDDSVDRSYAFPGIGGWDETPEAKSNYTGITERISNFAARFTNNTSLKMWLEQMVADGYISQAEGEKLFDTYAHISKELWSLESDGGTNWFGGVNGNAKYKDGGGNVYKGSEIVDALVAGGWSKETAKQYVINLQKKLGSHGT